MENFIKTKAKKAKWASLSAVVVHKDKILWQQGFGDSNPSQKPPTPVEPALTVYAVASISKTLVTTTLMTLFDAGKLFTTTLKSPIQYTQLLYT